MTEPQPDSAEFEWIFADAQDLQHLTYAARRLLAKAATLFDRNGVGQTSVRDITRACGLSPGALYNHFGSKDDVLHVLVCHGHDNLDRRLQQAAAAAGSTCRAQLAAFVEAYVLAHLEHPRLAQLVRREYTYLSDDRREEVIRKRRQLRQRLARMIADGERDGEFTLIGGTDRATRSAVMILDMCSRTSEWYHPDRGGTTVGQLADRYVQASLRLVGARSD
ncbi:TetR/AcrR family transcriptional regulator [uncultured Jatrophihabitans sp.]|uniref:TetR/AcrR family transcriptional regulator n=1 Tax=uncultured Jatrophihabitans sp. TaxID=1610747 RepID=UPI0035CB2E35